MGIGKSGIGVVGITNDSNSTIQKVDALKKELDALRPIKPECEEIIKSKFRLEFTFNSNSIEGNTLSFGETMMLILEGVEPENKPEQDKREILGHDEIIQDIEKLDNKRSVFSQQRIREYHLVMLGGEPFRIPAKDQEGNSTTRIVTPGQYKKQPNHVEKADSSIFYFEMPGEPTNAAMTELMDWTNKELSQITLHPVEFASLFHYRFVRIHPFDDGNGRMARILMNIILEINNYPPVIVYKDYKGEYIRVLELADQGNMLPLTNFIGSELIRSLGISIRGAKGENIEDQDDIDKKLEIKRLTLRKGKNDYDTKEQRKLDLQIKILRESFVSLVESVESNLAPFDEDFKEVNKRIDANIYPHSTLNSIFFRPVDKDFNGLAGKGIAGTVEYIIENYLSHKKEHPVEISYFVRYSGENKLSNEEKTITLDIRFVFKDEVYTIFAPHNLDSSIINRKLEDVLSQEKLADIKKKIIEGFMKELPEPARINK